MGMNVGGGGALNSDINVTPLVDVVLVLLIIFMVVTPLAQMGYDIQIPQEQTQVIPQDDQNRQVILAITENECRITQPTPTLPPDCTVRINREPTSLTDLPLKMVEIFKNRRGPERVLFLAAQEKLNYEGVVKILDIAKGAVGEDLKVGIVSDERVALSASQAAQ